METPQQGSASPISRVSDHPLSLCLSFLSMPQRFQLAARVCRQWNRVAALPTSNAAMMIRLQCSLSEFEPPSQGLVRWASQRAAGSSSSSASLFPSPPSIACGPDTAHPYARSSILCLIAEFVDGSADYGCVRAGRACPPVGTPNPAYLPELLGWPNLARAAHARGSMSERDVLRRASFEASARLSPASLQSLTLRSPFQAVDLGMGDGEWTDLLQWLAPTLAATSATVAAPSNTGRYRYDADEEDSVRAAAAAATAAAAKAAAALQFDPADSPFPRLSSLTIEGSALSWPVVQTLLRACPSIVHLTLVGTDLSAVCRDTCALLQTRGPHASVNGVRLNESRCSLCCDVAAPLLPCNLCAVVACGPCLTAASSARHHFLCHSSRRHPGGGLLYCYARGLCDDHVGFQCSECISDGAGDSSPGECGHCGCLSCHLHHTYGECTHVDDMYQCPKCRCRKCHSGEDDDDEEEGEDEDEEEEEESAAKIMEQQKRMQMMTRWKARRGGRR